MRTIDYKKIVNGLLAFERNEYKGLSVEFWDVVEDRYGLTPEPRIATGHINITDEDKFAFFVLKYSDVL